MSVTVDKLSGSKVRMEIEVSKEMFDKGLEVSFDKIKDEVEVKGFRKGKVTRDIFEQKFGVESLYEEAINYCIGESYFEAVTSNNVEVVAQPKIDLDVTKVEKGKGFTYVAEVAVKPVVSLGDYKGLEVAKGDDTVTQEEVDQSIQQMLTQKAELYVKEGAIASGDTAVFDFEGFVDNEPFEGGKAENYELVIGSGQFIPGFEDQMIGLVAGESKDVNVTFPEQYQAENLAGKDAVFKILLHEVKEKVVPELNEDFIADLDKEDIDTVDALIADTRKNLETQKAESNKNKFVDTVVETACNNANFDLPTEMVDDESKRLMDNTAQQAKQYGLDLDTYLMYTGMNKEAFEEQMRENATKSLSYNLVIMEVAKAESIEATEEETEAKYAEIAAMYNMSVEQVKQQAPEQAIKDEVIYKKTIDFLVDSAKAI